jgi:hypothetical protein
MRQILVRGSFLFTAVFAGSMLVLGCITLLCAAFFMAVRDMTSAPVALGLTALFPMAAAFGLWGLLRDAAEPSEPAATREDALTNLCSLTGAKLGAMVEGHPRKAALLSLAAGFAVGASPELRKNLQRLLAQE